MNKRSKTPTNDDPYCTGCSATSIINGHKRLSSFLCDHCNSSMCYDCFQKHSSKFVDEYSQIERRFSQLKNLFHNKQQLLNTFEDHCIRSVNSIFDEIVSDIENLRKESLNYVKQQFRDNEIVLTDMLANLKSLPVKPQDNWYRDNIKEIQTKEYEYQRKQMNEIENRLERFTFPIIKIKMSTFPRNKFDLNCLSTLNTYKSTNKFSPSYQGKIITTQCTCDPYYEYENEKIDIDTEVEELNHNHSSTKQIQTDPIIESKVNINEDEDEYFSLQEDLSELNNRINTEHCLSTKYISQSTILTQNEVDRIASDGKNLLYFSETSKSLCYVTNIVTDNYDHNISMTKEISCRWPHHSILDLVYSPVSQQFICATKTGVYTCTIHLDDDNPTIDIQMQLTQHCSYVRLSADENFIWLWTDSPRISQLRLYSPRTFDCIKSFNLSDYPRFSDNSTTFCAHSNIFATVFQYKQIANTPITPTYKKNFHVTFSDSIDLHELCTIRLGECDIDHEIRSNNNGKFFITNGKKKLWIVDSNGKKEYVKLPRIGRALTIYKKNQILIANGTQQLQCVELIQNV